MTDRYSKLAQNAELRREWAEKFGSDSHWFDVSVV
jgi:hypothetical protein